MLGEIGCIVVIVGWVTAQVIEDVREIRRARRGRSGAGARQRA
jgi:hypothetical protein